MNGIVYIYIRIDTNSGVKVSIHYRLIASLTATVTIHVKRVFLPSHSYRYPICMDLKEAIGEIKDIYIGLISTYNIYLLDACMIHVEG